MQADGRKIDTGLVPGIGTASIIEDANERLTVEISASWFRVDEAAVQPVALWTQFSSLNSTNVIPTKAATVGIDITHRRFTNLIVAPFCAVWKAAIRQRDELAIVVTGHVIRRVTFFRSLDDTITTHLARPPLR